MPKRVRSTQNRHFEAVANRAFLVFSWKRVQRVRYLELEHLECRAQRRYEVRAELVDRDQVEREVLEEREPAQRVGEHGAGEAAAAEQDEPAERRAREAGERREVPAAQLEAEPAPAAVRERDEARAGEPLGGRVLVEVVARDADERRVPQGGRPGGRGQLAVAGEAQDLHLARGEHGEGGESRLCVEIELVGR